MNKFYLGLLFIGLSILLLWYLEDMYYTHVVKYQNINIDKRIIQDIMDSENDKAINIYYINMTKSTERNNRFLSRLTDNYNPIRVEAVTPSTLPLIKSPVKCSAMMDTEYACLASHLKAIHTAYKNNEPFAFIAEDDAIILKNIDWNKLINSAPNDWEILQVHSCCVPKLFNKTFLSHYNHPESLWVKTKSIVASAAFYIINRKGMKNILKQYVIGYENEWNNINELNFLSSKVFCHADFILFHNVERYICTQILVDVENLESTIHWTHHKFYNKIDYQKQ